MPHAAPRVRRHTRALATTLALALVAPSHASDPAPTQAAPPPSEASALPGEASAVTPGEASAAPSGEASAAPSGEASAAPSGEASAAPSREASAAPPGQASAGPPEEAMLARPGWALRAAVEAEKQGDDARAETLLSEVALRHEIVADHAERMLVALLVRRGDTEAAVARAREALQRHARSPLAPRLQEALGDALAALGDEAGARDAWQTALDASEASTDRARLLRALARSFDRSGEPEAAGVVWLELWRDHPAAPGAAQAAARLAEIEAARGKPLRDANDHRLRGNALRALGRNEEAVVAYDAALAGTLSHRNRRRAMHSRARALFDVRRYPEAIQAFEALKPDPGAAVERARAMARAGDVPAAVAELERLAGAGWRGTSVYARYLAALLLEDEDELARARRHFEAVARETAHPRYANPAVWYLGWTAWRQGEFGEARERFASLEGRLDDDPIEQLQARYWRARAAEKLAAPEAGAAFAALGGEYPFTYYGWRAARRAAPVRNGPPEPLEPGRRSVDPEGLARARILLEAGLDGLAATELGRSASRARGLEDRLDVARLLADAGEYHRAQWLIVGPYQVELARGVVPGQEELWWLAWPAAYTSLIREVAPRDARIDTALVSAVMREESGYRPDVISPAGARGLLQIMPETGRRLASQVGLRAFTPDDLFRPRVNLQLGAFYLDQLTRQFDGRLEASIASYNAGPQAAARWTAEQPGLEDDEWVEAVPYSQTRAYVKRVLRSMHAYRELY